MPRQHNLEDEQPLLMSSASPSPTFGAAAAAAAAGDSSEAEAPLYKRKPHRFLILLFLINLLNYLDRYTISGILTPLENAFHISDSEGGLLMTVFVVSYLLLSPVFGYLGDRFNRKLLIGVGVTFWCLFTFGGSFSQSYAQLMVSRGLVGIGEASYATIAPTIIADIYSEEKRTMMLSIFYSAIPVGSALGYVIGSQVAALTGSWRWALRVSPPLGLALVIVYLIFTVDPPRGHSEVAHPVVNTKERKSGLGAFFDDLKTILKIRSFTWSTAAFTAVTFSTGALGQWAPTFVHRQSQVFAKPYSSDKAAFIFGAITCVTGFMGTFLGSFASKKLHNRTLAADGYVCGLGMLVAVPFLSMALPLADRFMPGFWMLTFVAEVLLFLNWAPCGAILLYVVPVAQRSSGESTQILFSHLFGDAFSPFIIGLVSDSLRHNYDLDKGNALMFALLITPVVALMGSACFLMSARYIPQDRQKISHEDLQTDYRIINDDALSVASVTPIMEST